MSILGIGFEVQGDGSLSLEEGELDVIGEEV